MGSTPVRRGEAAAWFQQMLVEAKDHPVFVLEGVLLDTTEQICVRMDELGISRTDLAERLGVSRQYVTKLLNGKPNLTLKSLVDIAMALDMDITVHIGGSQASRNAIVRPGRPGRKARANGRRKERAAA